MAGFTDLVDLACEKIGGKAIKASDDFFAPKENLLKEGRGIFIADKYTENGKWMDGWESRRRRTPGHDWCIIELGVTGIIHGFDIDTNHFLGNHPPEASVEACFSKGDPVDSDWVEILPKSNLNPGSQNLFEISNRKEWSHVRLNIFPDGGVARFRVYGEVTPHWEEIKSHGLIDVACVKNGGLVVGCNDMFFSSKDNIIMPRDGINMGDGWETKRRRQPGNDWTIIKLGCLASIRKIIVDTRFFKGNAPAKCSLEGINGDNLSLEALKSAPWQEILPQIELQANFVNSFDTKIKDVGLVHYVRLNIFPDGGVSRLRIFGEPL